MFYSDTATATVTLGKDENKPSICYDFATDEDLYRAIKFPNIRYLAEDADSYRMQHELNIERMYFYVQGQFKIAIPIDLVFLNPTG